MNTHIGRNAIFCAMLALGLAGCSSSSAPKPAGSGGSTQATSTGGNTGTTSSGGVTGTGGTTAATSAGGATGTGAGNGSGGTTGAGGAGTTGGAQGSGGRSGGGGASATGGSPGTGGTSTMSSTGGITGGGGSTPPDGAADARTGGAGDPDAASGGRTGTGGTTTSGGATGTGGGAASGGAMGSGGAAGGTTGSGGTTSGLTASYLIGADISFAESASAAGQDSLLSQLRAHGFNAIRLRTFVDPKAADGYDKTNGYCDIAHTVSFGKKVKDLGMALLVDFHYSDNWADPGKQCVPVAWQSYTTIDQLATAVYDYTKDSITKLIAGGARPDMVQIGNETTPGMLIHVCDSGGQPTGNNKVTGSTSNWTNLGALFKAGVKGVKDVDTGILTALHIDRGGDKATDSPGAALNTSKNYINNAVKQGVTFDVFGESCYQQYQGDPNSTANTKTGWTNTLGGLATVYPDLKIMAAEYGPMQREINDVVFGIPNNQGIGTFNWEPERGGDWNTGHTLFNWSGNTFTAQPDLALYDQMKIDYAGRL
jgi:arabinogalactan endo-1,4-beta-galactosidase